MLSSHAFEVIGLLQGRNPINLTGFDPMVSCVVKYACVTA